MSKFEESVQFDDLYKKVKGSITLLDHLKSKYEVIPNNDNFKMKCPLLKCSGKFIISQKTDLFYCFDCHSGGDIVSFESKMHGTTPMKSVRNLLNKYCAGGANESIT